MNHDSYIERHSNIPRLLVDFIASDNNNSFIIEELTFNPYIPTTLIYKNNAVDIWMEFSIKNIGDSKLEAPKLNLKYICDSGYNFIPSTQISRELTGINDAGDINFLMYSDIWYSFVRFGGNDREFMGYGYKKPIRILSLNDNQVEPSDAWITGNNNAFLYGNFRSNTYELRKRIIQFHKYLGSFPENISQNWKSENLSHQQAIFVPSDLNQFAAVNFEFTKNTLQGRFAFRRKPWDETASGDEYYGIGYGGTATIKSSASNEYTISPKLFNVKDSTPITAILDKNESVRFWLHFQSRDCLFSPGKKFDRVGFAFQIEVRPKVYSCNSFFRVPYGFEPVPGNMTELKHYATPPRLFFLWNQFFPEQCFAFSTVKDEANVFIELNVNFKDYNADTNRLVNLFIFGVLITFLANLIVGLLLSSDQNNFLVKTPYLLTCLIFALCITLTSTILVYKKIPIKISNTIVSVLLIIFCPVIPTKYLLFKIIILITSAIILISSFYLHAPFKRYLNKPIVPKFLKRLVDRYNYKKQLKKRGKQNV